MKPEELKVEETIATGLMKGHANSLLRAAASIILSTMDCQYGREEEQALDSMKELAKHANVQPSFVAATLIHGVMAGFLERAGKEMMSQMPNFGGTVGNC